MVGPGGSDSGVGRGSRGLCLQNILVRTGSPPTSQEAGVSGYERLSPYQSCQTHTPGSLDPPGRQQVGTPEPWAARLFLIMSVSFDVLAFLPWWPSLLFLAASKWRQRTASFHTRHLEFRSQSPRCLRPPGWARGSRGAGWPHLQT